MEQVTRPRGMPAAASLVQTSSAAFLVKVTASTPRGSTPAPCTRCMMRAMRVVVLPVPAPAGEWRWGGGLGSSSSSTGPQPAQDE